MTRTSLNWPLIIGNGVMRKNAIHDAESATAAILAEVARAKRAGAEVNLTRVAAQTGVSRATLYRALGER